MTVEELLRELAQMVAANPMLASYDVAMSWVDDTHVTRGSIDYVHPLAPGIVSLVLDQDRSPETPSFEDPDFVKNVKRAIFSAEDAAASAETAAHQLSDLLRKAGK